MLPNPTLFDDAKNPLSRVDHLFGKLFPSTMPVSYHLLSSEHGILQLVLYQSYDHLRT